MFFVKNPEARETLTRNWQEQVSDRRYLAIVEGRPKLPEGTIHNWLRQNKALRVYSMDHPEEHAEEAITHYKVIKEVTGFKTRPEDVHTLMELRLETGRTNQIRVHMADLGCPIVGDRKYGNAVVKGRLALHARRIAFKHPLDGREMVFESPLPHELKKLLRLY
jgi:23S rRNA pseudouridine1911/1915/1917 synthase